VLPFLFLVAAASQDVAPPSVSFARLPEGVARPVVDGVLDDEAWAHATVLDRFFQVEPDTGAPISERTEVLLLHDADAVFVALRCFDSDPAGIVGTQMLRDADLDPDDRVELYFDTFLDRRNAFWFQIGPGGSKGDALITKNGSGFNKDFDTIWFGRARETADGWQAEIEIPAASINFDPKRSSWGFNLRRHIRRKNEVGRWASWQRRHSFFSIAQAGTLTDVGPMHQGIGLDVTPFGVADWSTDRVARDTDFDSDVGLDAIYRITPSNKLTLSVNTDFAETEVDERIVNLTRFPVFFPEKRDFFLEDSSAFFFGSSSSGNGVIPFFSRRIGLDADGQEVPIDVALKLTGSTEAATWGVMDVQTGETGSVDAQNLLVGRYSHNFEDESDAGVIVTAGDPTGGERDATYGADLNLRTDGFLGDRNLRLSAYALETTGEASDDNRAYHLGLDYPNDTVNVTADYTVVERDFDPALGFVQRRDVKKYETRWQLRRRPGNDVRWYEFVFSPKLFTDTGNDTRSVEVLVRPFGVLWQSGESLSLDVLHLREVLTDDFEIQDGVVIPAGAYTFERAGAVFETSTRRPISGEASLFAGEFFDGDRTDAELGLEWRVNRHAILGAEFEVNDVDLPAGDFVVRAARGRVNLHFTPRVSWTNYAQYDSVSDDLGLNSRLRWILFPGRELNLVVNQSWLWDDATFRSQTSEITAKVSLSFRF